MDMIKVLAHGEIAGYIRKCDVHGEHGFLYPCQEYSKETLAEIETGTQKLG